MSSDWGVFNSECSDELNSRDIGEISSSTPEPGMSFVKVFTSVPLEPNAKSRQLECSADLEFSQIDDSTGNPSTRGHSMLLPMLGTALECDLAHYEAKPHWLHPENCYADYRNDPTSIWVAQTSRRQDHGYRGQPSSQLACWPYPLLSQSQVYNHAFTLPTMSRNELQQWLHDLQEKICLNVQIEMKEPQKAPDKPLEIDTVCNCASLYITAGPQSSNSYQCCSEWLWMRVSV